MNEDTIDTSVKTAKTLLLHLGYDPTWVEDKFIPRFDRNLTKLNQNKPNPVVGTGEEPTRLLSPFIDPLIGG